MAEVMSHFTVKNPDGEGVIQVELAAFLAEGTRTMATADYGTDHSSAACSIHLPHLTSGGREYFHVLGHNYDAKRGPEGQHISDDNKEDGELTFGVLGARLLITR